MGRRTTPGPDDARPDWLLREGGGDWSEAQRRRYRLMEFAFRGLFVASLLLLIVAVAAEGVIGVLAVVLATAAMVTSSRVRSALPYSDRLFDARESLRRARGDPKEPAPPSRTDVAFFVGLGVPWTAIGAGNFIAKDAPVVGALGVLVGVIWLIRAGWAVRRLERAAA